MASTYYLMKLFQKAVAERNKKSEVYRKNTNNVKSKVINKCRVCLREGNIHIFDENNPDLVLEVSYFSEIEIKMDDDFPKHLCETCYDLLQAAVMFRKTAQISHQTLIKTHKRPRSESFEFEDSTIETKTIKSKNEPSTTIFDKYFIKVIDDNPKSDNEKTTVKTKRKISRVQCKICLKVMTKYYSKEHLALHDPSISRHVCDVCGKSFRQRNSYKNHCFTHRSEFPYKCSLCPYRGRTSGLLNIHMRKHNGDYRYMCSECPARFLTKSNLNTHSLKHKEPTFQCDTCKRAFHSKLILERHFEANHLGIKKHFCDLCGKAFGYRKAMMRHQLEVHKREKKTNGRTPLYLETELKMQENNL